MDGFRVRVRVEIVPAGDADDASGEASDVNHVDEEAVRKVSASQAVSIDDMEEVLLENAYEVMRRALAEHFAKVVVRRKVGVGRPLLGRRGRREEGGAAEPASSHLFRTAFALSMNRASAPMRTGVRDDAATTAAWFWGRE